MVLGSVGCFLVIESRAHADARGRAPIARIAAVMTDRCSRGPGEAAAVASKQLTAMAPLLQAGPRMVISAATGVHAITAEEQAFLDSQGLPVRATGTALGHSLEAAFPASLALAAISVARGRPLAPLEAAEAPSEGEFREALVTSWGLWRGEAMALITQA